MEKAFWKQSGLGKLREADTSGDDALSAADIMRIKSAIALLGLDEDEDLKPYVEAIYSASEALVEAGYAGAKELLHIESGFDVVPAWAFTQVETYTAHLNSLVLAREKQTLLNELELAIANGDGARELAASIQELFAEGYHVLDQEGNVTRRLATPAWSTMVALTELSRASNLGAMAMYQAAGIQRIQWTAADGPTTCDECHNADGEVVKTGDTFPFVDVAFPPSSSELSLFDDSR